MKYFSVAPMMKYTDRHDRYFLRLISPHILLYTEMITAQALLKGNAERLLAYHPAEHPLSLQLGGANPEDLSNAARIGESFGYDEINLNVGCPSARVINGEFGACLMLKPELVADCVHAMIRSVKIPVTVKCRIGVDHMDSEEYLHHFISTVARKGVTTFIIHARKAWLKGLSPKENRQIPSLKYEVVYRLKETFPHLTIILNGGLTTLRDIENVLPYVDGVMIGRAAYHHPYLLADIERRFIKSKKILSREEIVFKMSSYLGEEMNKGTRLHAITRHLLGLYHGEPNAKHWRRFLSGRSSNENNLCILKEALNLV